MVVRSKEKLASAIKAMEKKTYTVMGKEVTFSFECFSGELHSWHNSIVNCFIQTNTFPILLMFLKTTL